MRARIVPVLVSLAIAAGCGGQQSETTPSPEEAAGVGDSVARNRRDTLGYTPSRDTALADTVARDAPSVGPGDTALIGERDTLGAGVQADTAMGHDTTRMGDTATVQPDTAGGWQRDTNAAGDSL
ncbi:MAG TPA: hypothetical protein VNK43_11845 [Gemmatimonadales bacterium]|nr:hypothetical protein [Gemmatimonadales bacterium]